MRILLLEIAADARAQARMQHLLALAGANKLISSSEHGLLLQMFCRDAISDVLKPDWQAVEAPARDRGVLWTRVHSLQSQVWRPCRWDGFRPARLHHTLKGRDSRQYHLEPCKPHMLMCTIWQGHLTMCVTHSTAVSYLQHIHHSGSKGMSCCKSMQKIDGVQKLLALRAFTGTFRVETWFPSGCICGRMIRRGLQPVDGY